MAVATIVLIPSIVAACQVSSRQPCTVGALLNTLQCDVATVSLCSWGSPSVSDDTEFVGNGFAVERVQKDGRSEILMAVTEADPEAHLRLGPDTWSVEVRKLVLGCEDRALAHARISCDEGVPNVSCGLPKHKADPACGSIASIEDSLRSISPEFAGLERVLSLLVCFRDRCLERPDLEACLDGVRSFAGMSWNDGSNAELWNRIRQELAIARDAAVGECTGGPWVEVPGQDQ